MDFIHRFNYNASYLISETPSQSWSSNYVQIVTSGARINDLDSMNGSSTKTTPPAWISLPQINPSILCGTGVNSVPDQKNNILSKEIIFYQKNNILSKNNNIRK